MKNVSVRYTQVEIILPLFFIVSISNLFLLLSYRATIGRIPMQEAALASLGQPSVHSSRRRLFFIVAFFPLQQL
jgi:hypothetical protein